MYDVYDLYYIYDLYDPNRHLPEVWKRLVELGPHTHALLGVCNLLAVDEISAESQPRGVCLISSVLGPFLTNTKQKNVRNRCKKMTLSPNVIFIRSPDFESF